MLEKELQIHKRDQKARDQAIAEKERKIHDLKKKNQELEKFKFVLDFKIKELKKQIEPRETQISSMKDRIKVCAARATQRQNGVWLIVSSIGGDAGYGR